MLGEKLKILFKLDGERLLEGEIVSEATRTHAETNSDGTLSRPARYGFGFLDRRLGERYVRVIQSRANVRSRRSRKHFWLR